MIVGRNSINITNQNSNGASALQTGHHAKSNVLFGSLGKSNYLTQPNSNIYTGQQAFMNRQNINMT